MSAAVHRLRVGAVEYLNTRPLVYGLERGMLDDRIDLSFATPARLADDLVDGRLDIGLIPTVELARIPDAEIAPGLGIVCFGATRSVLLYSRRPPRSVETVGLDPESRSSNALVRVLFRLAWDHAPRFVDGHAEDLADVRSALERHDAVVRIGDKALFETPPAGVEVHDLGTAWTDATGLPFVFAVWAARPGTIDREVYRGLHASRRLGSRHLPEIAEAWTFRGEATPAKSLAYLRENIRFRLGSTEVRAIERFFDAAASVGVVERPPTLRFAVARRTECHERAELARPHRGGNAP